MTTLLAWVLRVLDAALAILRSRLRAALLHNQRTLSPAAATSGPSSTAAAAGRELQLLQMDAHAPGHGPAPGGGTCISDLPDGIIEVSAQCLSTRGLCRDALAQAARQGGYKLGEGLFC